MRTDLVSDSAGDIVLGTATPSGPARVHVCLPPGAPLLVMLGHGAGGGIDAPDVVSLREAFLAAGIAVARMEQPYRVAGRRAPAPAGQLDAAWTAAVAAVRARLPAGLPLVVGGRSSGARVACRTAARTGAAAVLALSYPLCPPNRPAARQVRVEELIGVAVPVLVVQGERDPFGSPEQVRAAAPDVLVHAVPADNHALRAMAAHRDAVVRWVSQHGPSRPSAPVGR